MRNIEDIQEQFVDALSAIRRKKKLSQKDIQLTQKVISRIENHETDPRLSTLINYLTSIGYDINDLFKEEPIMKKPNAKMVEHLNFKLKDDESCLRYVEVRKEGDVTVYDLKVVDRYVDSSVGSTINVTTGFNAMVRDFFKQYGAEDIGFTNTIATIFTIN